jgi:hypothetical protein
MLIVFSFETVRKIRFFQVVVSKVFSPGKEKISEPLGKPKIPGIPGIPGQIQINSKFFKKFDRIWLQTASKPPYIKAACQNEQ